MALAVAWTNDGVVFSGEGPWGSSLDAAFPLPLTPTFRPTRQLQVLDRMITDGTAFHVDRGVLIPFETLFDLERLERADLRLPVDPVPVRVSLRTHGFAGSRDGLSVEASLSRMDGTALLGTRRVGAWVHDPGGGFLIDRASYELLRHIDAGAGTELEDHLRFLAELKRLAATCHTDFDTYLRNEEFLMPDGIGIEIDVLEPDHLVLHPTAQGISERFDDFERGTGPVRTCYTKSHGSKKLRLVLSKRQQATVSELRRRREIRGPDVARFLDNPEAFLPDDIDLSRFSPRVRGLIPRRYRSQPYLDVREGHPPRDWFYVSPRVELLSDTALVTFSHSEKAADAGREGASSNSRAVVEEACYSKPVPTIPVDQYTELCRRVVSSGECDVLYEGAWLSIEPRRARAFLEAMQEVEQSSDGQWRIASSRLGLVLDVISNVEQLEFELQPAEKVPRSMSPSYPPPKSLQAKLYPYQTFGYGWLRYLHENRLGGLLADEMGLGKTLQVLALFSYLHDEGILRPSLLVVPNGLVPSWRRELARSCPTITKIHEHHGFERVRDRDFLKRHELVITTYGTLRRDQLMLAEIDWQLVVCDEAQNVKNPTAQVTSVAKALKACTRVALTGTPVENGLSELWCIVDFVQPGKLGSWSEFRRAFERPIIVGSEAAAAQRLQQRLDPHYLRRLKEDVLKDLPEKREVRYRVPLSKQQLQAYVACRAALRSRQMNPLQALNHLIQLASHPQLTRPDQEGMTVDELLECCPKLAKTLEILEAIKSKGEKAVVFTRFRRMQDILQEVIADRVGCVAPIINGEDSGQLRQQRVDEFNRQPGFGTLILSPEAAGVGFNITEANHVIHYTRLWNPAKENQATDRVHRVGQKKIVTVHYPIAVGDDFKSIEEHLDELLIEKGRLAKNVLQARESLSIQADLERVLANESTAES